MARRIRDLAPETPNALTCRALLTHAAEVTRPRGSDRRDVVVRPFCETTSAAPKPTPESAIYLVELHGQPAECFTVHLREDGYIRAGSPGHAAAWSDRLWARYDELYDTYVQGGGA